MTQEQKDKLLKYLCMALPYGVKVQIQDNAGYDRKLQLSGYSLGYFYVDGDAFEEYEIKPYLRPMSSMTEEEIYDLAAIMTQGLPHDIDVEQGYFKVTCKELIDGLDHDIEYEFYVQDVVDGIFGIKGYDWLNAHHFDYRGLIDEGLALSTDEFDPYND